MLVGHGPSLDKANFHRGVAGLSPTNRQPLAFKYDRSYYLDMKGESSRGRIVAEGVQALSSAGLAGITVGRLADASGMSKSGMFAHFRSRQALETALLDEAARLAERHVVEPAMAFPVGLARLRALIDGWLGWAPRAGLPGGCPIAAALFELDDVEGETRDHVAVLDAHWRALLANLVREAIASGELAEQTSVDQFVWELCGIYLAHHSFSRFARDPDSDRRAKQAVDGLIDRNRIPAPPATR
ncbi:TetR/AcrR family transcriptional regulator [Aurantiacibacter flavus]|uniref:TetR/AcrR family transcriptional regulator n=1 Tax=Aurantiacibacter flavus TaxID=3145232 RepID=A0ABV0D2A4_9SPHN